MQGGKVFTIVSKSNGTVVAGHMYADQVGKLAGVINRFAGEDVVAVGEESYDWDGKGTFKIGDVEIAVNPTYAKAKDPHGWALAGIVALAKAPKARKRAAAKTTTGTAAKTTAKPAATRTRRAPLTAKPAAKTTAAKAKAA